MARRRDGPLLLLRLDGLLLFLLLRQTFLLDLLDLLDLL